MDLHQILYQKQILHKRKKMFCTFIIFKEYSFNFDKILKNICRILSVRILATDHDKLTNELLNETFRLYNGSRYHPLQFSDQYLILFNASNLTKNDPI